MRSLRAVARVSSLVLPLSLAWGCGRADDPTSAASTAASAAQRAEVTPAADPVVVAVGDIVCGTGSAVGAPCKDAETAALVGAISPDAVLLLGDNQYEKGSLADFNNFFDATWGAYKSITRPAVGNHEYGTSGAAGYFDYFNGVGAGTGPAGDRGKGYYSYDIGAWHVVVINSMCEKVGTCNVGSPQERWLRADLAAYPAMCTVAYWHHPRFSSGSHGNVLETQALWQALYDFGVDLALTGHDHHYERFAPQNGAGALDNARGVREFVVGTGGRELESLKAARPNSQLRHNKSFGVLKLTLRPTSYDWQFVPIPGHTLSDAGTGACHGVAPPPTTITVAPSADAHVVKTSPKVNFGASADLLADNSPVTRTYLRFDVTGVGAGSVVSAKLRLFATDSSNAGGRLHRVPSNTWAEGTLKWSNKPAYNSTVLGTIGRVVVGDWYEVDVTSQVAGDGTVGFVLESPSANGVAYASRETGTGTAPQLVIVVQ